MKKSVFRKLLPIILVIVLFAAALIYVEIFGMSNADILYRTTNVWIPVGLLALAFAVFHTDTLCNTIKKGERVKAAVQILQAVIVVVALVYAYILSTEMIPLGQQIEECMNTDDYKRCHELMDTQLMLRGKRDWTMWLTMVIVMLLEWLPSVIRKLSGCFGDKKKRGEDQ